ncbi:aminoglycoside phosphotransferase family protein [Paraburkholderia sp. RL18-103-BIB-C]|uniref:phosphotransferase n=1 Tax=unclassified Paraburkholderia TaxID=2615204 RepID=UPI0038BA9A08
MDTNTAESNRLLEALREGDFDGAPTLDDGVAGVASPMRLATEWAGFRVHVGHNEYYAKVLHEDVRPLIDVRKSADASRCAAETGVAPRVRVVDVTRGVLLFDALPASGWRWARVDDLMPPQRLPALWALKKAVHQGPKPDFSRSLTGELRLLRNLCRQAEVALPSGAPWIDECVDQACETLHAAQTDSVPVHGDGAASNVMIDADGQMKLIDFDRGGCFDPWYDVAVTLNELYPFEEDWRAGIAAWAGHCEERDYARCRLYALVDDWLWTLSASWSGATSARPLEFTKLGQWTYLRCRQSVQDPRFEGWLRQLRGVAA